MDKTQGSSRKPIGNRVKNILEQGINARLFPGAVALVACRDCAPIETAVGHHTYDLASMSMRTSTVFDVASITKVMVTTIAVLQLVHRRLISIYDPVARYIGALDVTGKRDATILHLLTHTSGLRAHARFKYDCEDAQQLIQAICRDPLLSEPGQRYIYTDLGFILLGHLVENISQQSLDLYAKEHIFEPLGMARTAYVPPNDWIADIAPTENDLEWRGRLLKGQVHDEKAFLLNGVAGHAGLFSTAQDIYRFAKSLLYCLEADSPFVLPRFLCELMIQNHTEALNVQQGLGWLLDLPYMGGLRPGAFGHTGFTGVSVTLNAHRSAICILLTNCVYPTRPAPDGRDLLLKIRSQVADVIAKA